LLSSLSIRLTLFPATNGRQGDIKGRTGEELCS
jgi:hypothetical protein